MNICLVFNRKAAKNILTNKKKFRDNDISNIVTNNTKVRSNQSPEVQNEQRNVVGNPTKRKKKFISQNLSPYCSMKL